MAWQGNDFASQLSQSDYISQLEARIAALEKANGANNATQANGVNNKDESESATAPPRRRSRYQAIEESDDEEIIPVKNELPAGKGKGKAAKGSAPAAGQKRKTREQSFDTARLSQSLSEIGVAVSPSPLAKKSRPNAPQRPVTKPPTRPIRPPPPVTAPVSKTKRPPPPPTTTPPPKSKRPPPPYKPASKTPLPRPNWTTPPAKPALLAKKKFTLPAGVTGSGRPVSRFQPATPASSAQTTTPGAPRHAPSARDQSPNTPTRNKPSASARKKLDRRSKSTSDGEKSKRSIAEIRDFEFKLVYKYLNEDKTAFDFHHCSDLRNDMPAFWSLLKRRLSEWEALAGADWMWELQKASSYERRRGGNRLCVTSKLKREGTKWRSGDTGHFACHNCASKVQPCFTWVEDGDGEADEPNGVRKGEFRCLPIHPNDRRCHVVKGKEIRYWVNEGECGDSESGESDDDESDFDTYRQDSDADEEHQSGSSGESSSEDTQMVEDEIGGW